MLFSEPWNKVSHPTRAKAGPQSNWHCIIDKVLGHARTEESIFFSDIRLLCAAPPFTLGSHAAPEAQIPSLIGNFTTCAVSKGERKGREEA